MPARRKQARAKEHPIGEKRYIVIHRETNGSCGTWDDVLVTVEDAKAELIEAAECDNDEYFACELVPRFRAQRPADITIEPI